MHQAGHAAAAREAPVDACTGARYIGPAPATKERDISLAFSELEPLLRKVAPLEKHPDASDIWEHVHRIVTCANTPTMAQGACETMIAMCHAGAWGARHVDGYERWHAFLDELAGAAIVCVQRLYERHSPSARVDA